MKKINDFTNSEEGAIIVFAALSIVLVLVCAAFAADLGYAYLKASSTQNAADAAALAAARLLPVSPDDAPGISGVYAAAVEYAEKNNYIITAEDVGLGDLVSGKYTSVKVKIPCEAGLDFSKVIGISSVDVSRSAGARAAPCASADDISPLCVDYLELKSAIESGNTEHIILKYGSGDGDTGSYGAIDLDGVMGGGANDFSSWLQFGYRGTITVGDGLLPVEKGNMSGPTELAISSRYSECTHFSDDGGCCAEHFVPECPRLLKVLVVSKVSNSYVMVKGFAAFIIESESASGEIRGSYIKALEPGGKPGGEDDYNYGLYCVGLTS
ncbi:MAG: pilus assembly protein TadG-related protein [Bacillota bacterium]|nr:pilus assembly protein TadG-related protein [Bacillota bacterium]